MDPKKQDLTPELKQIYDRVMNTQVPNKPVGAAPVPNTPQAPPATATTPIPSTPQPFDAGIDKLPSGNLGASTTGAQGNPSAQNEGFLSSVPPRPITETKPFVFTGNKITTPEGQSTIHVPNVSGKQISGKVIALLVVVLIIAWAVFWSKFFGLF